MPSAGAVQVTAVAACWRQVEGGRSPFASGDLSASSSAASSGLVVIRLLADADGMAMAGWRRGWDPKPPPARTQLAVPAATRTSAATAASRRDLEGLPGRRADLPRERSSPWVA